MPSRSFCRPAAGQFGATTNLLFPAARQSRQWRIRTAGAVRVCNRETSSEDALFAAIDTPTMKNNDDIESALAILPCGSDPAYWIHAAPAQPHALASAVLVGEF